MTAKTEAPKTSTIVAAIEAAWNDVRERHPELPAVMVTIGTGSGPRGKLKLGHFAALRWQWGEGRLHELFVGGEGLKLGAEDVLVTVLHEAAHTLANVREVQDTSRGGRYHNRRFADLAREVGLEPSLDDKLGWSPTKLTEASHIEYGPTITALAEALQVYRHAEAPTPRGTSRKNWNFVAATCGCGRKIRAAASTFEDGDIGCGLCGTPFEPEVDDE